MRSLLIALMVSACSSNVDPAEDSKIAISAAPLSASRGVNTYTIRVEHDDATEIEATTWMPSMGHGSKDPRVSKLDDNSYRLEDVVFSMPGAWDLRVRVACAHGITSKTFRFEVP